MTDVKGEGVMNWYVRSGIVMLGVVAMAMLGCGTATNNDQGVSFTMLGYSVAANASATPGSGSSAAACSTAPNLSSGVFAIGTQTETSGSTPQVLAGVVVRNNLTTQFVRTVSIQFEYIIPGAQIQPPSTTVPYGGVVAKSGGLQCGVVSVVPPQVLSWISLNRESLPEPPFLVIARGQVTGTTQAGDVLSTNPVDIGFTAVTDNPITPSDDSVDGAAAVGETVGVTDGTSDGTGESESPVVDDDSGAQI